MYCVNNNSCMFNKRGVVEGWALCVRSRRTVSLSNNGSHLVNNLKVSIHFVFMDPRVLISPRVDPEIFFGGVNLFICVWSKGHFYIG